jgi:hypothetical protein
VSANPFFCPGKDCEAACETALDLRPAFIDRKRDDHMACSCPPCGCDQCIATTRRAREGPSEEERERSRAPQTKLWERAA